jgi:hypothetical protein
MLLQATKRFILGWAQITSSNLVLNGDFVKGQTALNGTTTTAGTYAYYFAAAAAIVVKTDNLDVDNVTITGSLLPIEVASLSADLVEAAAGGSRNNLATYVNGNGSTVANQGAASNDIVVYQYDNYGLQLDRSENPVQLGLLQLNGHDRFDQRDGDYFNYVQPYQCFSNTPNDGVNVYSFALTPEEHQPSGTCNFSRIDNATLALTLGRAGESATTFKNLYLNTDCDLNIYAFNYNVLRVMSGMAGLAYSN